jgi:DNA-binding NtrC family response regulator
VIHLHVPALRDRPEDIPPLAQHFLEQTAKRIDRPHLNLSAGAMQALEDGAWPGNVRELENTIERAAILTPSDVIEASDLLPGVRSAKPSRSCPDLPEGGLVLRGAVEAFENELIRQALERTGWNKNQAARLLGLNRTTLVEMLKRKRLPSCAA